MAQHRVILREASEVYQSCLFLYSKSYKDWKVNVKSSNICCFGVFTTYSGIFRVYQPINWIWEVSQQLNDWHCERFKQTHKRNGVDSDQWVWYDLHIGPQ